MVIVLRVHLDWGRLVALNGQYTGEHVRGNAVEFAGLTVVLPHLFPQGRSFVLALLHLHRKKTAQVVWHANFYVVSFIPSDVQNTTLSVYRGLCGLT